MTALAELGGPLAAAGALLLVLLVASRAVGLAARVGIWISERFGGRDELYEEGRAVDGRLDRYGEARSRLAPRGKVFVSGELWDAVAEGTITAGERVEVVGLEGLVLHVRPAGRNHDQGG